MTNDNHLLVPLDGSVLAESVLPLARMLAENMDAEITYFSALPGAWAPAATRDVVEYLQEVAEAQHDLGMTTHIAFRLGEPVTQMLEVIRESEVDMVVMATHGRSGPGRSLFGSVADPMLRISPVPIVLLHPNEPVTTRLRTLVVPIDGTPGGAVALDAAIPLARSANARVVLVRAVPLSPVAAGVSREAGAAYVTSVAHRLGRGGLDVSGVARTGEPAAAIIAVAEDVNADLIVMSTHGRGGAARSILGSVADEVVRKSRRPVLLVRRAQSSPGDVHDVRAASRLPSVPPLRP